MSDALQRLIDAVEAGSDAPFHDLTYSDLDGFGQRFINLVQQANHGDMNAAKSLHDALLPGWWWAKEPEGLGGTVSVGCPDVRSSDSNPAFAEADNPARAWLLAILRAYQQVQQ